MIIGGGSRVLTHGFHHFFAKTVLQCRQIRNVSQGFVVLFTGPTDMWRSAIGSFFKKKIKSENKNKFTNPKNVFTDNHALRVKFLPEYKNPSLKF